MSNDRQEIEDLLSAYAIYLDVDDIEACIALFTAEGRFEVYGRSFDGHDGLRSMLTAAPRGMHLAGSSMIEVSGPTATARQQLIFIDPATDEMRLAIYDDGFLRTADGWRFLSRRCRFLTPDGLSDRPAKKG